VYEVILMNVAVFSDTHGRASGMAAAVAECRPDAVIHCGDGSRDVKRIQEEFPDIPIYQVAGNCDYDPVLPLAATAEFCGVRVFIAHGHSFGVRYGNLDRLVYAAQEAGAAVALYGHTHRAKADMIGGVAVINPGTAGMGTEPTWCMLEFHPGGGFKWEFRKI
jgi:putative phosphoesterase